MGETLRDAAEFYRTVAERSHKEAGRDHLLECATELARIADWIAESRPFSAAAGQAATAGQSNVELREFYASENGDRWHLARSAASGDVFVRHEANLPSGGHITDEKLATFLSGPAGSPEREALTRLISVLVRAGQ